MKTIKLFIFIFSINLFVWSCAQSGPKEINLGKDPCDYCKMTIVEKNYATQLITNKGRVYKFDDLFCLNKFSETNTDKSNGSIKYVVDFPTGKWINLSKATLISGGTIKSPMNGNTQAYQNKNVATKEASKLGAVIKN